MEMQILKAKDLASVIPFSSVITIPARATVAEALTILETHKIHSAPVVDDEGKAHGFIDVLDITCYLLQVMELPEHIFKEELPELKQEDVPILFQRILRFSCQLVANTINLSSRNPFIALSPETPLSEVVSLFCEGIHRVPLVDDSNNITHIVSQSALVRFLAQRIQNLGEICHKRIDELHVGTLAHNNAFAHIDHVTSLTTALDAFKQMARKRLNSLAVVDEHGKLIAQLSSSDIRSIGAKLVASPSHFADLLLPLSDFLRQQHGCCRLVSCPPQATIKEVIQKLCEHRVHRVYIVENGTQLRGVVSITDIAKVVAHRLFAPSGSYCV